MQRKIYNYIQKCDIAPENDLTAAEVLRLQQNYGDDVTKLIYSAFKFGYQVCYETMKDNQ